MTYKEYIELGFKRVEMNDTVEAHKTGYTGFTLHKELNDKMFIEAYWTELDKPTLYIIKRDTSDCTRHLLNITTEMVKDLCMPFKAPSL